MNILVSNAEGAHKTTRKKSYYLEALIEMRTNFSFFPPPPVSIRPSSRSPSDRIETPTNPKGLLGPDRRLIGRKLDGIHARDGGFDFKMPYELPPLRVRRESHSECLRAVVVASQVERSQTRAATVD